MLESLTADHFRSNIGDAYRLVSSTNEATDTVLATVTEHPIRPGDTRAPFDIVFCAPPGTMLGQGLYRLEHAKGVIEDLFVVPLGPDPDGEGMLYQAVFG